MKKDLRGYAVFTCEGGFTENFLDYCVKNSIPLKNIAFTDKGIRAEIRITEYHRLKKAAVTSSSYLHITGYRGYPVILSLAAKYAGTLTGLAVSFLLLFYLTGCIWRIEVRGNETVYKDEIISCLEECGVKQGTWKKSFDINEVEAKMAEMLDGRVHWLSLNTEGSTALVEIMEKPQADEYVPFGQPCNFVADFDGVIESISVKRGKAQLREGSAVKKGDLIISGVINNSDGSACMYEADGDCTARHTKSINADFSHTVFLKPCDTAKRFTVCFFSLKIPSCRAAEYDEKFSFSHYAEIRSIILPLKIIRELYCRLEKAQPGKEQMRLIMCENMFYKMRAQLSQADVIKRRFTVKNNSMTAKILCTESIGVQTAIKTAQ